MSTKKKTASIVIVSRLRDQKCDVMLKMHSCLVGNQGRNKTELPFHSEKTYWRTTKDRSEYLQILNGKERTTSYGIRGENDKA